MCTVLKKTSQFSRSGKDCRRRVTGRNDKIPDRKKGRRKIVFNATSVSLLTSERATSLFTCRSSVLPLYPPFF